MSEGEQVLAATVDGLKKIIEEKDAEIEALLERVQQLEEKVTRNLTAAQRRSLFYV